MDAGLRANGPVWAIGLMSGTSLDGVDAALLHTDGKRILAFGPSLTIPYDDAMRARLREATLHQTHIAELARDITEVHAQAVLALLAKSDMPAEDVSLLGFHGQTVLHAPDKGITWQIGDAALLVERTGIPCVTDFRTRDVAAGGQGAPLVPLFHAALAEFLQLPRPVCFLNLGGISNITYLGEGDFIFACDAGPANGLLNEWMFARRGVAMDEGGKAALNGKVHNEALDFWMNHDFFQQPGSKSLDRHSFDLSPIQGLSVEDGAATLIAFAASAVEVAAQDLPVAPQIWVACGGGVHNEALMQSLKARLGDVRKASAIGLNSDAIEAQAFAYLALRSVRGWPTSLPSTTGSRRAVVGGAFYPL